MNIIQRFTANREARKTADTFFEIQLILGEMLEQAKTHPMKQEADYYGHFQSDAYVGKQPVVVLYYETAQLAYDLTPTHCHAYIAARLQHTLKASPKSTLNELLAQPIAALTYDDYFFVATQQHYLREVGEDLYCFGTPKNQVA